MHYLSGNEEDAARKYMNLAANAALDATCMRHMCGAVIIKDDAVIGTGYNSPPGNDEGQRRCSNPKDSYNKKITDKTCCVHAEQRAIMDALRNNPTRIAGSRIYFMRLGKDNKSTESGKPYCTICSKMALDVGIEEFAILHDKGICIYDTKEYNTTSFQYSD
jgi:deoxycytidylate deaminase